MIDPAHIQIRQNCPLPLEQSFLGQIARIAAGDELWGWSSVVQLIRLALIDTGLSEPIKAGLKCTYAQKQDLSYHFVLISGTDKGNNCDVSFRFEVIADCLGLSVAGIEMLVKTKPPEFISVSFSTADN
jgi:hypothetical protein